MSCQAYLRSGAELSRAVGRLDEARVLTRGCTIDHVPPGRVTALARVPNQVKRSLPICVQKPFLALCRAPVSSTDTQDDVSSPAHDTSVHAISLSA